MKKYPLFFLLKNSFYKKEEASKELHEKIIQEAEVIELKPISNIKKTILWLFFIIFILF